MQKDRCKAIRKNMALLRVTLACFLLLGFGTLAKTIQNWPDLNAKLQTSNSCKIERIEREGLNCDLLAVPQAPVTVLTAGKVLSWVVPETDPSAPATPFVPVLFSRPPPFQL